MKLPRCVLALALLLSALDARAAAPMTGALTLSPSQVTLNGKADRQQLLVTASVDGRPTDRTRKARFHSEAPGIVGVSPTGLVTPVGDGTGAIVATVDGQTVRATVRVTSAGRYRPVTFERDVLPILARAARRQELIQ